MWTKIVAKLKTGSVPNVVPFGVGNLPAAPYVVVKREGHLLGIGYRVIAHFDAGQQILLEDYITDECIGLLQDFTAVTRRGNDQTLKFDDDEQPTIVTSNDDGTISAEHVFYVPKPSFF
jgi:hypothetical protein